LPAPFRQSMERAFGLDFAPVRVQSGAVARRAVERVGAQALALGTTIALPEGVPDAPSATALPLVVHELTHVAQHLAARPTIAAPSHRPLSLARRASAEEHEADRIERLVAGAVSGKGPEPFRAAALPLVHVPSLARLPDQGTDPQHPIARAPATAAGGAVALSPPATVETPAAAVPGPAADAAGQPEAIAERVYALLEQRLLTERERSGTFR